MPHLLIAAAHKSSGKTTLTLGVARALRDKGFIVQTFKKGPDYIDPMWHARATGRPCYNLDFNTQTHGEILAMLAAKSAASDIALIEANMGLYDGVDLEGRDGNAALAKLVGAPVVLVVDTEGMTRGIAPLLIGHRVFDPEINLAGVILNRVAGERHEAKLRAAVERYTGIPVIGALPRTAAFELPERHLGLTTPAETNEVEAFIGRIAAAVAERCDLDCLRDIAASATRLPAPQIVPHASSGRDGDRVRIAIARCSAFGFYYPDDLEALQQAGAALEFFDAQRDPHLPPCDGLFIGGGFPETHMDALAANATLRAEIKQALEQGLPAYAECGGLMYLTRAIRWGEKRADMVGVIDAEAVMHVRPQGRGQVVLAETLDFPWPRTEASATAAVQIVKAHEFHHASLVDLPADTRFGFDMRRGDGIDGRHDGIVKHNTLACFAHQRSTDANHWAHRFVAFVRERKGARQAQHKASRDARAAATTTPSLASQTR